MENWCQRQDLLHHQWLPVPNLLFHEWQHLLYQGGLQEYACEVPETPVGRNPHHREVLPVWGCACTLCCSGGHSALCQHRDLRISVFVVTEDAFLIPTPKACKTCLEQFRNLLTCHVFVLHLSCGRWCRTLYSDKISGSFVYHVHIVRHGHYNELRIWIVF